MGREKVAVIDGGGRGAALVDRYLQSKNVGSVIAVPGNDMMRVGHEKQVEVFPNIRTIDVKEIVELCKYKGISLVDVAQDDAVYVGLVDALQKAHIPVVGPTRSAGKIEWSKASARAFGERYGLLQPEFHIFYSEDAGISFLKSNQDRPWFVKANGLCAGKGAKAAENNVEAIERIKQVAQLDRGSDIFVVEEWLRNDDGTNGEEFSAFYVSDGEKIKPIGFAQDHKAVNNFDKGDNTGGMGCSAPPLVLTEEIKTNVSRICNHTINCLEVEGRRYKGILYFGGMLIQRHGKLEIYTIEFNSRWGDPEAQVLLPGIKNDLFEIGMAVANGNIRNLEIVEDGKARVVVAGVSKGYPGDYNEVKGSRIYGLEKAAKMDGIKLYGAGVQVVEGKYYADGGRLFYVVGEGRNVIEARKKAYAAMSVVAVEGNNLHYRTDIGGKDVNRLSLRT